MGQSTTRRCRAIRYGIQRARRDKRAMDVAAQALIELKSLPARLLVAYIFPLALGMVAPLIFTTAGWAWNREMRRPVREESTAL